MNCPQCQTVNGPGAAFCGNCGARLAAAGAPTGAGGQTSATGTPPYVPRSSPSGLAPVNFDLTRLTTADKIVAGGTLVTMISLWLPWFSASYLGQAGGSISGTADHGWLWLEFVLALVLIAYLAARVAWDQLPFRLPLAHTPLLIAGTGLQFLLVLIGFLAMPSADGIPGLSITWDVGAVLALIASIVAAGPVTYPAVKSYLDSRNATGSRTY